MEQPDRVEGLSNTVDDGRRMSVAMKKSMVTSQRYVDGAGTETRLAAGLNPLYGLLNTD